MSLIADIFSKLRTPKKVVKYSTKMSRFGGPFGKKHVKRVQTVLQSERQHRDRIYWSFWR